VTETSPQYAVAVNDDAARLHGNSIVVNGLAQPGNLAFAYDTMINGGITATNLTVAANEGFAEAVKRFEHALRTLETHPRGEKLTMVTDADEIRAAKAQGRAGVMMGFQNADPIEDDLDYLHAFYRLGLRILQLTYQRRNRLGDGCAEPADGGLSIFGREVVAACNELGILVDLSHCGYRTTMEGIEASSVPVVISHANLYAINPIMRNKRDDTIRLLAQHDGVMGITSASRLMSAKGNEEGADLDQYLDQIDYMIDLVGPDHVGVGLDISEGMTQEEFERRRATFLTKFPELRFGGDFPLEHYFARGISSAAQFPNITTGLQRRGYSEEVIRKIIGGNFMRVFQATLT
jgi:membrane dipeptidase